MRDTIIRYRVLAEITSLLSEGYSIMTQATINRDSFMTLRHGRNRNKIKVRWNDNGYLLYKNNRLIKQEGSI